MLHRVLSSAGVLWARQLILVVVIICTRLVTLVVVAVGLRGSGVVGLGSGT